MVEIDLGEFKRIELKVGKILEVKEHPNANKLLVLTVDLGEGKNRIIVAGLRNYYKAEELEGKKAIFVTNLKPAILRGVESNGMILATVTENHEQVKILLVDGDVPTGTKIS